MNSRESLFRAIACCLGLALAGMPAPSRAQDAVFDAIGSHLSENVLYAQAQLQISTPLLTLSDVAIGTGDNSFLIKGSDGAYRLWNLQAGSQQAIVKVSGSLVAPSAGGTTIFVGGKDGSVTLVDTQSGKAFANLPGKGNAVTSLAGSANDELVYVGYADGSLGAWQLDGRKLAWLSQVSGAALVRIAADLDGAAVAAADSSGTIAAVDPASGTVLSKASLTGAPIALQAGRNGIAAIDAGGAAIRSGTALDLGPAAFADIGLTGASAVLLRKNGDLDLVDLNSGKTRQRIAELDKPIAGLIYDEAAAKAIVIEAGGTMKVYDTETKELVLSIFISQQGWAMIDRQGRFDGSSSGLRGISWAVKKANFPITSLSQAFADPGMLSTLLDHDRRQLRQVPGNPGEKFPLPPSVEIEPISTDLAGDKPYQLLVVASDQGGGIKDIRLYHNGKIVDVGAVLEQKDAEADGKHIRVVGYNVWPVPGPNVFQAIATGIYDNPGTQAELRQTFSGTPRKGQLNLITVGVSKYTRLPKEYQLKVAANDAGRLKSAISTYAQNVFSGIAATDLTDTKASRASILAALDHLKSAKPEDSVILFLSGHGVSDESDWYFLPSDASADDSNSWISATDIRTALEKSGAQRVFVIIDACYSGGTVENFYAVSSFQKRFLTNGLRSSGIQVLTATRRDQLAPESADLGAGFLTYLVDQALKGKGDIDPRDGWISSQEVAKYTYGALPELFLAQREKNPKAFRASYGADVQQPDVYTIGADLLIARTQP